MVWIWSLATRICGEMEREEGRRREDGFQLRGDDGKEGSVV